MAAGGVPFVTDPALLAAAVDVSAASGVLELGRLDRRRYRDVVAFWRRLAEAELPEGELVLNSVRSVGPGEVVCSWRVSFVAPSLTWLLRLAAAWPGGLDVEKVDYLHKMGDVTRFRWRGLFQLLRRAVVARKLRCPTAAIDGSSTLRFEKRAEGEEWELASHAERLDLVGFVNKGAVRNRRVGADLLLFLEQRRLPAGLGPLGSGWEEGDDDREWDFHVRERVDFASVPGMGQLDVDGLEPERQADLLEDVSLLLAFGTLVMLTSAGVFANYLWQQRVAQERVWAELEKLY